MEILSFVWVAVVILSVMVIIYLIAILLHDYSLVDIVYSLNFIVGTLTALFLEGKFGWYNFLLFGFVFIWGTRLSYHILKRKIKQKNEDFRYQEMRRNWAPYSNLQAFFKIFLFQGLIIYLINFEVILGILLSITVPFHWLMGVGSGIWLVGFLFESIGDRQLRKFVANPNNKGKIMESGLWRYTRHPNYFGEVTMWWGLFWIILPATFPIGFIGILSPLLITFLILKVSGIPLLEKRYANNVVYQAYKKRTSIFIPLPPKKLRYS